MGLIGNPLFTPVYGWATDDWKGAARAVETESVLAAGVWAGGAAWGAYNGTFLGAATYVGESAAIGYGSGFATAKIYGASTSDAMRMGLKGAEISAAASLLLVGYTGVTRSEVGSLTPLEKMDSTNTIGYARKPNLLNQFTDPGFIDETGTGSELLYKTKFVQMVSGPHDWFTGTVGEGLRLPSSPLMAGLTNIPVLGNIGYNVAMMGVAAVWTAGALAAETGTTAALTFMHDGYNPYQP